MRLTPTLLATILVASTALTACSKQDNDFAGGNSFSSEDGTPDIAPSAAPNVAFSYAYRFALAAGDIAAVQEKHAAACEALGLARCRITGVRYQRSGNDRAHADLSVVLAPEIARKFGKDAAAAVEAARGTLADVQIGGVDQSRALQSSAESLALARAERARLEKALADRATPPAVARELTEQLAAQRSFEQSATREERETRTLIDATPMHFIYSTDGYMPGLSIDRTTKAALSFASTLLNGLLALAVVLLALAVPLGIALLGLAHGRRLASRVWARLAPQPIPMID